MKSCASLNRVDVYAGDCREVLAGHPEESIDTCLTDPPYGLSFMGKAWDHGVPGVEFWREVLRVLKPGAHLLAFGGTRTYHRLTCAIEDAGFEIRDCMMWLYGTGFPKSHDISKGIDKARAEDAPRLREFCRFVRAGMDAAGLRSSDLAPSFGCHSRLIDHWAARDTDSQPSLPTREQFEKLKALIGLDGSGDDLFDYLDARRGEPSDDWKSAPIVGECRPLKSGLQRLPSDTARAWRGYGTALKPAWEPIIVAMKPTAGTFAANALAHGVAGLNIDGARIAHASADDLAKSMAKNPGRTDKVTSGTYGEGRPQQSVNRDGRWPANVLLDEVAAATLDHGAADVSRFFYCAKASRKERGDYNTHPTVKPLDLMRYLCRLTKTPSGGVVLDPFAGSGSTLIAAALEGRDAIGIELDRDHVEIIRKRLADHLSTPEQSPQSSDSMSLAEPQPSLFEEAG